MIIKKMYHFIYKTTNLITGMYYIGMHSTRNLEDGYLGSGKILKRAVKKYGKENFKLEIIEFLPNRRALKKREKQLVNEDLLKDPMCMNLQPGGGGGLTSEKHKIAFQSAGSKAGLKALEKLHKDPEYKKKFSNIRKMVWENLSDEQKARILRNHEHWTGKKHSDETKRKIGLANSGYQKKHGNSQLGTIWITNGYEVKKIKKEDKIPNGWRKGRGLYNKSVYDKVVKELLTK